MKVIRIVKNKIKTLVNSSIIFYILFVAGTGTLLAKVSEYRHKEDVARAAGWLDVDEFILKHNIEVNL